MKKANSFLCYVDMCDGVPVGDAVAIIEKAKSAANEVAKMTKATFRLRFTARGSRGITLKTCKRAAVYIYMKRS